MESRKIILHTACSKAIDKDKGTTKGMVQDPTKEDDEHYLQTEKKFNNPITIASSCIDNTLRLLFVIEPLTKIMVLSRMAITKP